MTPPAVTVYGTDGCHQCRSVTRVLGARGIPHTYVNASEDDGAMAYLHAEGVQQVPYVVIQMPNGEHRTFTGNRRDILDELFPRVAA